MAEYTRDFHVEIYRDTNKATYRDRFENPLAAICALLPTLGGEDKRALRIMLGENVSDGDVGE